MKQIIKELESWHCTIFLCYDELLIVGYEGINFIFYTENTHPIYLSKLDNWRGETNEISSAEEARKIMIEKSLPI